MTQTKTREDVVRQKKSAATEASAAVADLKIAH
jgi:hypothetical protein